MVGEKCKEKKVVIVTRKKSKGKKNMSEDPANEKRAQTEVPLIPCLNERKKDSQRDRETERQRDIQIDRQTNRETDKQTDRQTGRQTDRMTE